MDSLDASSNGTSILEEDLAILVKHPDSELEGEIREEWSVSESVPDLVEPEPEPLAQLTLVTAPAAREYKPMPAHPSERFTEFHLFPFLPTELRLKVRFRTQSMSNPLLHHLQRHR